ncbi:MAG: transglycosylase SLT domain-containing protein [Acidimicrobiia bacterium]|jgi:membrane-bound lytic murein transglycosylase B
MRRLSPAAVVAAIVAVAVLTAGTWELTRSEEVAPSTTTSEPPATTSTTEAPSTTTTTAAATTTTEPVDVFALQPPPAAGDPVALAAQIEAAEAAIRDPASSAVELATAALSQQVAYRALGARPEWDGEVLARLPEALRGPAQLHVAARREFRAMHRTLSPTIPAWQIVPPAPADELLAHYQAAEAEFGIPWQYLAAINLVETATGRIRGTSVAGAQGPMQFMPATWEAYGAGGDVNDHRDAIMGAARYLAANNGAQDIDFALFRYNRSQRYVRGVKLYADLVAEHPRAWFGLYHWGVWYLSEAGEVYLPVGFHATEPIPARDYLASR